MMTMYNGTSIVSLVYITDGSDPAGGDLTQPQSACRMRITFTTTNATVVFSWGGHIGRGTDWGIGNSAGGISGSPYHTRLIAIDGSGGNQDRSLSAAAVLPPTCNITGSFSVCTGSVNTYTGPAGTGYTYVWAVINNTSNASIVGSSTNPTVSVNAGTTAGGFDLQITVTGPLGSTSTCSQHVTVAGINATCTVNSNVSCNGGTNGSATVSASGGTAPYTGTGLKSNLAAGSYTYTITDANGCSTTCSVTITQPTELIAASSVASNVSCNGGNNGSANVTASGGTLAYTGTGLKSNLTAGTYTYTVTDANGCTASTSVTITQPSALIASAVVNSNVNCHGESNGSATVSATGGTPPYSGDGLKSNLAAGTYTYTVTDANGCTATATATITQPSELIAASSVGANVSCNGGNNGSATVTVSGGTAPYSGDGLKSNLTAGTYTYTVTDAHGCTSSTSVTITQPTELVAASSVASNVSCNGGNNGSANVTASGGTAPYTGTGLKSNLTAGTYTYTVTDAHGCTSSTSVTISEPTVLHASSVVNSNVNCHGESNGSATVSATGGTAPYTGTGLKSNLAAGTYTYTVTDAHGCTATTSVTITQPTELIAASSVGSNVSCFGGNNGSATVSASGGTAPYTGDGLKSNLTAGTYTYTVTDAHGCTSSTSVTITQPTELHASSVVNSNADCNGNNNGSATVSASGGTAPYTGDGLKSGLAAGTYTYTVTDAHGCTATTSVTITEPSGLLAASAVVTNVNCNGGSDGSANVTASGGTAPYTGTGLKSNLAAGTYTYTVTDAHGCTSNTSVTITEPTVLHASSVVNSNVNCHGESNGSATVSATGGTVPYTGTGLKSNLAAGTYTYTVTDAHGCTATTSVTITQPSELIAASSVGSNVSCFGGNNGSATVTASGGTAPYTGDGLKSNLAAGTYNYTVTDVHGCTSSTSVTITQPTELHASSVVNSNASCNGNNNGSATVSASGGTAPYSGDGLKSGLAAGTYTYTVTDAHGCTATTSVTITEPSGLLAASSVVTNVNCNGGNDGSANVTASGGTAPYTGTGLKSNLAAGTYTYTVTDAHGCTSNTSVTITQPTSLHASSVVNSNVNCHGESNGSATVSATGGTAPYTGTGLKSNLAAGTYTYTVTDAHGCTATTSVTITQPTELIAASSVNSNVGCNGGNSGSANVTASGGTAPYTGTGLKSNLAAGTYTYTVTDAHGCTSSTSVTITQPAALTVTCMSSNSPASISSSPSGGTMPYSYNWSPGGYTTQNINVSSTGTYTLIVTDAHQCTATTSCSVIISCQGFRTQTQGGWGAEPHGKNPGSYLTTNFSAAFPAPNYLTVGCATGNKLKLTNARAVTDFLPSGSTPRALPAGTLVNPGGSYSNVFAGQVVTLTISVGFDLYYANFSPATTHLQDLIIASGTFAGWSVKNVLIEANKKLGGCYSAYSFSTLNDVVSKINENFDDGVKDNHFLVCPQLARTSSSPLTDQFETDELVIKTYPNPFTSTTTIEFAKLDKDAKVTLEVYNMTGTLVAKLFDENVISGNQYTVTFDGSDLPSGIYIYQLVTNSNLHSGRLILMR